MGEPKTKGKTGTANTPKTDPTKTSSVAVQQITALKKIISEQADKIQTLTSHVTALHEKVGLIETHVSLAQESKVRQDQDIEEIQQYLRKTTLLFTGPKVPEFKEGENTALLVCTLVNECLGESLNVRDLTACHRLRNKQVILARFAYLDDRIRVYDKRTKPIIHGLTVYEHLTPKRRKLAEVCQRLRHEKDTDGKPIMASFFTRFGRVYIKAEKESRPVELDLNMSEQKVRDLCEAIKHPEILSQSGYTKPKEHVRKTQKPQKPKPKANGPQSQPPKFTIPLSNSFQALAPETPPPLAPESPTHQNLIPIDLLHHPAQKSPSKSSSTDMHSDSVEHRDTEHKNETSETRRNLRSNSSTTQ